MDFYDVVKNRKSVRSYKPDKVPEDMLLRIMEAARLAPSWANRQCWRYVIVDDPGLISRIAPGMVKTFGAPMMIVLCADPMQSGQREGKDYYLVDAAISMSTPRACVCRGRPGHLLVAGRWKRLRYGKLWELGKLRVVAITLLGYSGRRRAGNYQQRVPRPQSAYPSETDRRDRLS
jgi:nitroreductase